MATKPMPHQQLTGCCPLWPGHLPTPSELGPQCFLTTQSTDHLAQLLSPCSHMLPVYNDIQIPHAHPNLGLVCPVSRSISFPTRPSSPSAYSTPHTNVPSCVLAGPQAPQGFPTSLRTVPTAAPPQKPSTHPLALSICISGFHLLLGGQPCDLLAQTACLEETVAAPETGFCHV